MWEPQVSALVADCRCIPIDFRGFGNSTPAPPYSMDRYADDVVAVLDSLQIERAVVVGLSLGGYVAFALWRRHRARVRGLVLADTRATADTIEIAQRRREMIDTVETQGSTAVANTQILALVGRTTRDRRPDIFDSMHRMMAQAPVEGIVGALEAMIARPDSTPTLATIDVPTLVVVGEEDTVTPPTEAVALSASISGSRIEVLQQAGHLSNVERPAAFNTVVSEFLGSLLYN
jgi:pimeloyl-ACP methyl ester carboxylesterase